MILTLFTAFAASTADLTWNLSANGASVGTRQAKVKIVPGDDGMRRILEVWTQIDGKFGPVAVQFRQRLTAHVQGGQPASFHSVIDQNGEATEIQGRWAAGGWTVTSNLDGHTRTAEYGVSRIDFSTSDLFDPLSHVGLDGRTKARVLSAITGDVLEGGVSSLGSSALKIDDVQVAVQGWSWSSPEGRSDFFYSSEGYLVKFRMVLLGVAVEGLLAAPPPGGVDDFPVATGRPAVDILPL